MTLQRAAKSLAAAPVGTVQVTARERMKRVSAARAFAPQGHVLPLSALQVSSASCVSMPSSLITTASVGGPASSVPASSTFTLK